jgi:nonribosomal peptide synthetase DhbF
VRRFFEKFECGLHNLYGPTEAAVDVTSWECAPQEGSAAVPIGRPITNTAIHILDRNYELVPAGVAGELYIAGVAVGRGYHHRPSLTAERFIPCPYSTDPGARMYRTGDLARWRSDGSIEFLGRIDYQVKIRGFRIELGEIEARLAEHEAVAQSVVVALPDRSGEHRLIAYLECRDAARPDAAELRRHLNARLPEYMVPSTYVMLDRLPLNANGKVDRNALPSPASHAADSGTQWVPPRNPVEFQLAEIWGEVLGVERIGVHHDFFGLGGHSLQITQVLSRVRSTFEVEIPVRTVFEEPTIAAMAARLESLRAERSGGLARAAAASGDRDEGEL